jgi:hypothetical protein
MRWHQFETYCFVFENITIEEEEGCGIHQLAYAKIKELDEWKQSVDC